AAQQARVQRVVEVREEVPAARWLPAQGGAEVVGFELQHHQPGLAVEMPARRLLRLGGGGEVDIAVGEIDGRALEPSRGAGGVPLAAREDLVVSAQAVPAGYSPR